MRTSRDRQPDQQCTVEPLADGRVTFRLCAPEAQDVRVTSSDRPSPEASSWTTSQRNTTSRSETSSPGLARPPRQQHPFGLTGMAPDTPSDVATTYNSAFHRGCRLHQERAEKHPSHLIWVVPA